MRKFFEQSFSFLKAKKFKMGMTNFFKRKFSRVKRGRESKMVGTLHWFIAFI